jgi:hypothetical protein
LQPVNFDQLYGQRMQEMAQQQYGAQTGAPTDEAVVDQGKVEIVDAEFPKDD